MFPTVFQSRRCIACQRLNVGDSFVHKKIAAPTETRFGSAAIAVLAPSQCPIDPPSRGFKTRIRAFALRSCDRFTFSDEINYSRF